MTKLRFLRLSGAIAYLGLAGVGWAAVPNQPSVVTVQGTQLIVRKRLPDGTLSPAVPYTIKGIDWSPATSAPDTGPLPPGAPPLGGCTSNQYGFFFDFNCGATPRTPQGHVIMNYWLANEHFAHYQQDIPLLAQMHVNTVRLYGDFGDDPSVYGPILDAFYNNHIMVVMTVPASKADVDSGRFLQVMSHCQNHPAILMWAIGNEWNLTSPPNVFFGYPDYASAASGLNTAAQQMKVQDPSHPVSSSLGDKFSGTIANGAVPAIVGAMPAVDIWALNIYRGSTFTNLFTQWAQITPKPFYFSEFGIDSFSTDPTGFTQIGNGEAHVTSGHEDQATQSTWDLGLWNLIEAQLSSVSSAQSCAGGFVFSWNDALWKVGNFNVGLGNLPSSNYTGDTDYSTQERDGFFFPGGFPDNIDNEEYFGIVDANRNPKLVYLALQAFYPTVSPLPMTSVEILPSSAALHYNQSVRLTAAAQDAFQEPLLPQPAITWSVSPSTGASIDASGTFISFVTSGTYQVTAQSGVFTSSIAVVVANAPPAIAEPAAAASNPVRSTGTLLSVLATDDRGESGLTYAWSTVGIIPAPVQFLDLQGLNSSKAMRVAFSAVGRYAFIVTVADQDGAVTTSQVVVQIDALSGPTDLPGDFSSLRVYPNPWRSDLHAGHDITFDGLMGHSTIRIFTLSAHWVRQLGPGDAAISWDRRNDAGELVASGLYFYVITNDQGQKTRGKLAIIR